MAVFHQNGAHTADSVYEKIHDTGNDDTRKDDTRNDDNKEFVDNILYVKRESCSQCCPADLQVVGSRNTLRVKRYLISSGSLPRARSINEVSVQGHRGWLTDQLRGKRVWCTIYKNRLCIFENTNTTPSIQAILLPGCSFRQLNFRSADQHNGVTRHFMSRSIRRLDKFHFILENPVSGQQFFFAVDTQYELSQWQAALEKICSTNTDYPVAGDKQSGDSGARTLISQLRRACSEPKLPTDVTQSPLSDMCAPTTTLPFVRDYMFPVQSNHKTTDMIDSDQENRDPVQSDQENRDSVQSDQENRDLAQTDQENRDSVQSDQEKRDPVVSDEEKRDPVVSDEEKTDTFDSVRLGVLDRSESSDIKCLPVKVNENIDENGNTEARASNSGSNTRQARPVLTFKSALAGLFRRVTRSASADRRRRLHSRSDLQAHGNTIYASWSADTESSYLNLETSFNKKKFVSARQSQPVHSGVYSNYSGRHSLSAQRLTATTYGDDAFYKDVFPKFTRATRRDLREVCLSGYLLCITGPVLRRAYCALSLGCLYVFSSVDLGAIPEQTISLNQYNVTYVSEIDERSGSLFVLKLSHPEKDSIYLYADSQQTLLKWLTAMQSASARIQSADDLVCELSVKKNARDITTIQTPCLQDCRHGTSDKWHLCAHMNADFLRPEVSENLDVAEDSKTCNLSMPIGISRSSINTAKNSVFQPLNKSAIIWQPISRQHDLFNRCPVPLYSDQREISRFSDVMSTDVAHNGNTETCSGGLLSNSFIQVQGRSQPVGSLNSRTVNDTCFLTPASNFKRSACCSSELLEEANAENVHMALPGVCSSSLQVVNETDNPAPTSCQQQSHNIPCSDIASTHKTNRNAVLDTSDKIYQSLDQNVDESKSIVIQGYQFESLVHDDAVKQKWSTTEHCLLEVVKDKLRLRSKRRTLHTDSYQRRHDVCVVYDHWNLADTNSYISL